MIILVRHGEAIHHTEHLTGGWTDSCLTAQGEHQIEKVAAKLAYDLRGQKQPWRLLCSDLKRAARSAELLAPCLSPNIRLEKFSFLREKNNGLAAGMKESSALKIYRPAEVLGDIDHRNYPGGETRREFYQRTVSGMQQCCDWERENLLIVSHKGTVQNLVFAWLGLSIMQVYSLKISVDICPASVTVLGINKWQEHCIFLLNAPAEMTSGGYGFVHFKYGNIDEASAK